MKCLIGEFEELKTELKNSGNINISYEQELLIKLRMFNYAYACIMDSEYRDELEAPNCYEQIQKMYDELKTISERRKKIENINNQII